jgi:hypothetical protein
MKDFVAHLPGLVVGIAIGLGALRYHFARRARREERKVDVAPPVRAPLQWDHCEDALAERRMRDR